MSVTATSSRSGDAASSLASVQDQQKSFRQADFLKIMLAEVTSQSPFDPQETSKLVENMQKLQELANTTYSKFRNDIRWAQDLMGQTVNVQEVALDPAETEKLKNKGVNPAVGFANKNGRIESFRVVDETVWVTVNQKDYPLDNVKQVIPDRRDEQQLTDMAQALVGRRVTWVDEQDAVQSGTVSSVFYGDDGSVQMSVGGKQVRRDQLVSIGQ